jgi:hypothetical protein
MIVSPGYKPKPVSDEELMQMQAGQRLRGLLPEAEATVKKAQHRIALQIEQLISKGELTAERALAAWYEYAAHSNVLRTMQNEARLGEAAGERLAKTVNQ